MYREGDVKWYARNVVIAGHKTRKGIGLNLIVKIVKVVVKIKGYQALVGVDVSIGGMFAYFLKEQEAKEWIKKNMSLLFNEGLIKKKLEGKVGIVDLQKCKLCDNLTEVDLGKYCLKCEDLLQEAREEKYSETIEVSR